MLLLRRYSYEQWWRRSSSMCQYWGINARRVRRHKRFSVSKATSCTHQTKGRWWLPRSPYIEMCCLSKEEFSTGNLFLFSLFYSGNCPSYERGSDITKCAFTCFKILEPVMNKWAQPCSNRLLDKPLSIAHTRALGDALFEPSRTRIGPEIGN